MRKKSDIDYLHTFRQAKKADKEISYFGNFPMIF